MAAAGKPLDTVDVISYILAGLDDDYDGFVAAITALMKAEKDVSLSDVYSQFMSYESRMEARNNGGGASVNAAHRGGRNGGRGRGPFPDQYRDQGGQFQYRDQRNNYDQRSNNYRGGYRGGRGNDGGGYRGGRGNGGRSYAPGRSDETCQVCGKTGHTALNCWKRFQKSYHGPDKSAGAAYGSYGVDTNWYSDSGATDHVTGELEKLHVRDRYNGNEQIHTASGAVPLLSHLRRNQVKILLQMVFLVIFRVLVRIPETILPLKLTTHRLPRDLDAYPLRIARRPRIVRHRQATLSPRAWRTQVRPLGHLRARVVARRSLPGSLPPQIPLPQDLLWLFPLMHSSTQDLVRPVRLMCLLLDLLRKACL
ncbi:hypothetical protein QYE76_057431 [Lolium multiflorum]|uniref:CCHC-type domain-containing protein n=1 Tax=Lolium multiflorum TaxID=4521 RepID=A0AAD8T3S8_LOLMU|nr:hypothetical protein QYE76_057431 [Lolium multiflorum]